MQRRQFCIGALSWALLSPLSWANTESATYWVASSAGDNSPRLGLLKFQQGQLSVQSSTPLPTRAHGFVLLPDNSVIAIARRPGEWIARWKPFEQAPAKLFWLEPGEQLNGHACLHPDQKHLLCTQTNTEDDSGLIVVRDLETLKIQASWPTSSADPHALLYLPQQKALWVANGGIATRPETGRTPRYDLPFDSSVVKLDIHTGKLLERWTLSDSFLSLRHLAFHPSSQTLGIAMQAMHANMEKKMQSSILAVLPIEGKQRQLKVSSKIPISLAGYGGDIIDTPDGFAVSCPKTNCLSFWDLEARLISTQQAPEVCALSRQNANLWVGTADGVQTITESGSSTIAAAALNDFLIDNHWQVFKN